MATIASGASQLTTDGILYDLLGVYPLIDGDSTDEQVMTNDSPLPRYWFRGRRDPGAGQSRLANARLLRRHVTYTDSDNVQRTVNIGVSLGGTGNVVSTQKASPASARCRCRPTAGAVSSRSMPFNSPLRPVGYLPST